MSESAERLDRLEAQVLGQEHRLLLALRNFSRRGEWPKGDLRRRAVWVALAWSLLGRGTTIVALGGDGLVAWLTYAEISRQTILAREQNALIETQNASLLTIFEQEKRERLLQRRTDLVRLLWEVEPANDGEIVPVHSARVRTDAIFELLPVLRDLAREPVAMYRHDLAGCRLDGVRAADLELSDTDFTVADLTGASLRSSHLAGAALWAANLTGANLSKSVLWDAIMKGALLRDADLREADMSGADLHDADLTGADLSGANLADARGLTQKQLDSASGDSSTSIPVGLARPDHWR